MWTFMFSFRIGGGRGSPQPPVSAGGGGSGSGGGADSGGGAVSGGGAGVSGGAVVGAGAGDVVASVSAGMETVMVPVPAGLFVSEGCVGNSSVMVWHPTSTTPAATTAPTEILGIGTPYI
jgi:hypothetical protein